MPDAAMGTENMPEFIDLSLHRSPFMKEAPKLYKFAALAISSYS